jgi:hypothetical protein
MDDLNVIVNKPLLVISPTEIKVKVGTTFYNLTGFPSLGINFTYLYYEPETNHVRKVIPGADGNLVYEALTADEISKIEQQLNLLNDADYLANFLNEYEKKLESFVQDNTVIAEDPQVYYVASDKVTSGSKLSSQLNSDDIEITHEQLDSKNFSNSVTPDSIWDDAQAKFVGKTYKDKRTFAYYDQLKYNDQFAAIWAFIQSSGIVLPAETQAALDKIIAIKAANPKV